MALMSIMELTMGFTISLQARAVEVIHPMSTSSSELLETRQRITDVVNLTNQEFRVAAEPDLIKLIPLVEVVPQLVTIKGVLGEYITRSADSA